MYRVSVNQRQGSNQGIRLLVNSAAIMTRLTARTPYCDNEDVNVVNSTVPKITARNKLQVAAELAGVDLVSVVKRYAYGCEVKDGYA